MSQRNSNCDREDGIGDESNNNLRGGNVVNGGGAFSSTTTNPNALFGALAGNTADLATPQQQQQQQVDLLQQLQAFLPQAQQNSAPPLPPPPAPAPPPVLPQPPPQPQQQQQQDAIPMLMNALLNARPTSLTRTSNIEVNQTLLLAMAQLVQYRNLTQFLMQLLSQIIGPMPLQMLLGTMGSLPPSFVPPNVPLNTNQQQPVAALPFLAAMGQELAQHLAPQNGAPTTTNLNMPVNHQFPIVLSQFQNFLQQIAAGTNIPNANNHHHNTNTVAHMTHPFPGTLFLTNGNSVSGNAAFDSANNNGDYYDSPEVARHQSSAVGGEEEPPVPLPVRKRRKYDHESFPEKVRTNGKSCELQLVLSSDQTTDMILPLFYAAPSTHSGGTREWQRLYCKILGERIPISNTRLPRL